MRSTAALLAVGSLCTFVAGCGGYGFAAQEAGSTLEPRRPFEAGSTLEPRFQLPPRDPDPREAGSTLSPRRLSPSRDQPEAGSVLSPRRTGRRDEAGSVLHRETGSVLVRRPGNQAAAGNGSLDAAENHTNGGSPATFISQKRLTPFALVLISLGGAALILFTLFKLGMSNPYAGEVWTRRLDLCCDLAGQLDTFMDSVRREDWDRCQSILDALHATNGRRAVLLANGTNSALFRFLQVAINGRLSARDPEYRRNLENKFALAVEALRKASRQSELLSLENRQFLVDANKSYRSLRDRA
ncbi:MAG TPA: hypothetical protein VML55_25900 [Planctomycetaceae bacterium]|nr:hypothetical protein [Planctomycetaceae bacterium]